jgi:hypothetical protein
MVEFEPLFDSRIHENGFGDVVRVRVGECLKPFGYWHEYYLPENDRSHDTASLKTLLRNAYDMWTKMRKPIDSWLRYQEYSRSSFDNEYIATQRRRFEPQLNKFETALREIVEFCGDSVDKPGR